MLTLSLQFIFHFLLPVSPCYFLPPTYHHPSLPLSHPPILSPSIHPFCPPRWTGHSDLYLSGMDESQVWFKCPNYSPELWRSALGCAAPSLRLSYESWHGATEPFTEARLEHVHLSGSPHAPGHEKLTVGVEKLAAWKRSGLLWFMPRTLYNTLLLFWLNYEFTVWRSEPHAGKLGLKYYWMN